MKTPKPTRTQIKKFINFEIEKNKDYNDKIFLKYKNSKIVNTDTILITTTNTRSIVYGSFGSFKLLYYVVKTKECLYTIKIKDFINWYNFLIREGEINDNEII